MERTSPKNKSMHLKIKNKINRHSEQVFNELKPTNERNDIEIWDDNQNYSREETCHSIGNNHLVDTRDDIETLNESKFDIGNERTRCTNELNNTHQTSASIFVKKSA